MTLSVMFPVMPERIEDLVRFARHVADGPCHRLWMGQTLTYETFQALAYLAGAGVRLPVGTGVALTPLRHPYEAALQARTVAQLMGHPVVAAFGTGGQEFAQDMLGAPYARPATAVAEYLTVARHTLAGEYFEFHGEYHRVCSGLYPVRHPGVELGAGVLRPGMARKAGATADVAVTWLTPPAYLAEVVRPALEAGARSAGRRPPRIAAVVHVAVARPGRDPRRLAYLGNAGHLVTDHYVDMLRRAGLDVSADDPEKGAQALVEAGVLAYGAPGRIARELEGYRAAGVDEVVLSPVGVCADEGFDAALADLDDIARAVSG
ncbi:LLM class flavin-dependent oxidoreductase [Streptomyces coeruleorubidus]|uniref:LLM class flavin-dependent oxidoreductase n=1 Tax=Streptomyces coeruleorubidus TaxID=116188 RepID=UPI0036FF1302